MRNETLGKKLERIIADVLLFFIVLFCPWWLSAAAVFCCIIYFQNYYEAFFAGIFMDALYGTDVISFHGFHLFFAAVSLAVLFVVQGLKDKMRV